MAVCCVEVDVWCCLSRKYSRKCTWWIWTLV